MQKSKKGCALEHFQIIFGKFKPKPLESGILSRFQIKVLTNSLQKLKSSVLFYIKVFVFIHF